MSEVHYGAGVIVENDDNGVLLVQEGKEKVEGLWNIPSGGHEPGETIRETAVRETKEETGLKVELTGMVGLYYKDSQVHDNYDILVVFAAETTSEKARPEKEEEIRKAEFRDFQDLEKLNFRFNVKQIIQDYRENGVKEVPTRNI